MGMNSDGKLSFVENFVLSGTAAVISKTAVAPVERVKLLLQNQNEMLRTGRLKVPYSGAIDCFVRTYKVEGILPFWRSNLANCIRYFPQQALNFAFKDKIKRLFPSNKNDGFSKKFIKNIGSGGAAGVLSQCFIYSLDFARTRLANDVIAAGKDSQRLYSGIIDVYVKTLRSDGIWGLYRGFVVSCVCYAAYRGMYFGFYDTLKPILFGDHAGMLHSFMLGYFVTVTAGLTVYPLDTVRRRMMMTSGEAVKYSNSRACILYIMRNESYRSFYKGAGANIVRSVAGGGVLAGFDKFQSIYTALKQTH